MTIKSKLWKTTRYLAFLTLVTVVVLELAYRYQWINFYNRELNALNDSKIKNADYLVIGDSFGAHPNSYVKHLQDHYNHKTFINASIPGTGIRQHKLIIRDRIRDYQPKTVIYQYYVGNDLTDIQHPVSWSNLNFTRNLYWSIADHLLMLQYLNYRLSSFKPEDKIANLHEASFNQHNYNTRVKTYLKSNPGLYKDIISLSEEYASIYSDWKVHFSEFLDEIPIETEVIFVIVPHCIQVNQIYRERYQQLGAQIPENITNKAFLKRFKNDFPTIRIIDPLKTLQTHLHSKELYYANDPHLTLKGQEVLGKEIISKM